jgi:hypothetical protein
MATKISQNFFNWTHKLTKNIVIVAVLVLLWKGKLLLKFIEIIRKIVRIYRIFQKINFL